MKILLNGYTVTEHMELKRCKKDLDLANNMLEHIKRNKGLYLKLVIFTAVLLHLDCLAYASDFGASLDNVGNQILNMLLNVAKWGCLSMGIKDMVITMLNGGNIKQAMSNGLLYLLGYIFINMYPSLFNMFSNIKF